jgi:hypothetical protein
VKRIFKLIKIGTKKCFSSSQVPRSRRVSAKSKESSTNSAPKSIPSIDDANSLQATPLLPLSVIPKPPIHSDLFEQRQHQQDLPLSDEPSNEQQWQRVSSNRGQRKGTTTTVTPRRETNDESQATNKTVKSSSTNPGKCRVFHLNGIFYAVLFVFACVLLDTVCLLFCISLFYRKPNGTIIATYTVASSTWKTPDSKTITHTNP